MALVIADRVRETTVTSGTADIALGGAVTGFQSFAVIGNNNTTYYCIAGQGTNEWEVGIGTYISGTNTLQRTTVLSNSSGTAPSKINFLAGTKDVFVTYPASKSVDTDTAQTLSNKTIASGVINSTTIGASTPSTGAFTSLSSTSTTTLNGTTIPANKTLVDTDSSQTLTNKTLGSGTSISTDQPSVISVNSTSAALRITQTGAGNALVVEDSANPDASPFVVDANGVAIVGNTTSVPVWGFSNALQVWGGFGYTSQGRFTNDAFGSFATHVKSRNTTIGSHTIVQNGDELGRYVFAGSDGSAFIAGADIRAAVDGTPGTSDMPGRLVFSTTADGASSPTERMRIDSAGNVGIGAASSAGTNFTVSKNITGATLAISMGNFGQIQSDVTTEARYFTTAPSTAAASFTLPDLRHYVAFQGSFGAGSTVTNQVAFYAGANLTGATNNYGFFSNIASGTGRWNFYASGTAANYFAGNVGIGIGSSSPTAELDVVGSLVNGQFLVSNNKTNAAEKYGSFGVTHYTNAEEPALAMAIQSSATENNILIGGALGEFNAATGIRFYTAANNTTTSGTERMRIDSAGSVGIGTSSPGSTLHVSTSGDTSIQLTKTSQSNWLMQTFDSGVLRFYSMTAAAERIRIDGAGSVGIGTTGLTTSKLRVLQGATQVAFMSEGANTPGYPQFGFSGQTADNGGRGAGMYLPGDSTLAFSTTATERMRIDSAGNIGIGGAASAGRTIDITKVITGSTSSYGVNQRGQVQTDVTSDVVGFRNVASTITGFTLPSYSHFLASQGTLSGTVTSQYGFHAESTLIGATNNYGFFSNIASGTGRWNFYASGTAANYFAGITGIGGAPGSDEALRVSQDATRRRLTVDIASDTAIVGPSLKFYRTRTTGTNVQNGDLLGEIIFQGTHTSTFPFAADIQAFVDGAPGANDMPGRLVFRTAADGTSSPTERMRIDSAGRVGIGTTDPKLTLTIGGNGVSFYRAAGAADQKYADITDDGTNYDFRFVNDAYNAANTGIRMFRGTGYTVGGVVFYTGNPNAERMRIDSSGNVGIGTSSPGSKLHVKNGSNATEYYTGGAWAAQIYNANDAADAHGLVVGNRWAGAASKPFEVGSLYSPGGTWNSYLVVNGAGNVGIGTNSPGYRLDVQGTAATSRIRATSGIPTALVESAQAAGYAPAFLNLRRLGATDNATPNASTVGEIRFDGLDASNTYTQFAGINCAIGTNAAGGAPGELIFLTASSGATATERMRINSSGNVGIGTSSPGAKLHVSGGAANTYIQVTGANDNAYYGMDAGGVWSGTTSATLPFRVFTNNAERMRIDSSGNVGIGTSSPAAPLNIFRDASGTLNGTVELQRFNSNAGNVNYLKIESVRHTAGSDWNGVKFRIQHQVDATPMAFIDFNPGNSQQDLSFGTANTERMRISNAGKVGIGTITPLHNLQVSRSLTGSVFQQAIVSDGVIQSDVTTQARLFSSYANTAAAAFSTSVVHYMVEQGTFGAGSTVTNQWGMFLSNALTGATNNYGIHANIPIVGGKNNWNIYVDGAAPNYFAGKVGIANNSPSYTLDIGGDGKLRAASSTGSMIYDGLTTLTLTGSSGSEISFVKTGTLASTSSIGFGGPIRYRSDIFNEAASSGHIWSVDGNEVMRLDASGNLLVNTTADPRVVGGKGTYIQSAATYSALVLAKTFNGTISFVQFFHNGTIIGDIASTNTTTAYNTSSDYRLKENVQPMQNALATVAQLNPVTYTWKVDGSAGQGFIAHELQAVVPDAVTGEKDAVDKDGKPAYQGVDTSFLVATLTKAIQEQQDIINSLKARLDAAGL